MSARGGLGWRLARLAAMGPAEIAWRLEESARLGWESRRAGRERFRPLFAPVGSELRAAVAEGLRPLTPPPAWRERLAREFPQALARLGERARAAREGRVTLFARELTVGPPGGPAAWQADPASGRRAPARAARSVDYRDPRQVGSARRIWELNRHHHLAEAALWAWAERDREVGAFVVAQLLDWCDRNPPLVGVNWTSALELAVRSLAWAEILALLGDVGEPALDDAALGLLVGAWARQVEHVRAHDSRHSSANNHRIGEAAAVAVAGLALPFHPRAEEWWRWGSRTLEAEILRQIAPDGVDREQAFAYQRFVLDFATVVVAMARGHGKDLRPAAHAQLRAAAEFLAAVTRPDGQPFPVGDDDEGRAFALGESFAECATATLECLGWLYGEPAWRRGSYPRARWLGLAGEVGSVAGDATGERRGHPAPARLAARVFPDSGYVILAAETTAGPVQALFDAGPLGYGTLSAHGHADALALCLWAGEDVLIDPGTGSYHGDPEWREALRGTRAHNTCEVDGRDQSERRGLFLWGRKAQSALEGAEARTPYWVAAGRHDGYRDAGAAETRRTVAGCVTGADMLLVVVDEVRASGARRLRVPWHLGAGVPEPLPGGEQPAWRVRYPGGARLEACAAALGACGRLAADTARGGDGPTGAWYAPRFEERAPEGRIAVEVPAEGPAAVVWLLRVRRPGARDPEPDAGWTVAPAEGGLAVGCGLGGARRWRALIADPRRDEVAEGGESLRGRLAAWMTGEAPTAGGPLAAVAGARALVTASASWRSEAAPVTGVVSSPPAAPLARSGAQLSGSPEDRSS